VVAERPVRLVEARPASDAELIEGSLREPSCFAAIFDRHADAILRYACARLGPDLGEEVTAETFLAAFGRRAHYDLSRADARPWLYGIAVRQIGKHRRSEMRRSRLAVPAEPTAGDIGDRCAERVTAQQLRPQLTKVLNALPRRDRELLLLIAWTELSYAEAADALGITVSAVRSRLNRIRTRVRAELGGANPATTNQEVSNG
jgi:RNA polymerase sigma-70 factor (ECF subfamily)